MLKPLDNDEIMNIDERCNIYSPKIVKVVSSGVLGY